MKLSKYYLLFFALIWTGCADGLKERREQAVAYNQKLVSFSQPITLEMNGLFSRTTDLLNAAMIGQITEMQIANSKGVFEKLISTINTNTDSVKSLIEFDDEIRLKGASLNYLKVCQSTLEDEYLELFEAVQKEMDRKNIIKTGELVLIIWERLIQVEKESREIERRFAQKYNFPHNSYSQNWELIDEQFKAYKSQFELMKNGLIGKLPSP